MNPHQDTNHPASGGRQLLHRSRHVASVVLLIAAPVALILVETAGGHIG